MPSDVVVSIRNKNLFSYCHDGDLALAAAAWGCKLLDLHENPRVCRCDHHLYLHTCVKDLFHVSYRLTFLNIEVLHDMWL